MNSAEISLRQRVTDAREPGTLLLAAMQEKLDKLNPGGEPIAIPSFDSALFKLEEDQYNGWQSLRALFFPDRKKCAGFMLFHGDGSSFAEYRVGRRHPNYPLLIEAVEAWISNGEIKVDVRLCHGSV